MPRRALRSITLTKTLSVIVAGVELSPGSLSSLFVKVKTKFGMKSTCEMISFLDAVEETPRVSWTDRPSTLENQDRWKMTLKAKCVCPQDRGTTADVLNPFHAAPNRNVKALNETTREIHPAMCIIAQLR